ncbi:cupin domain-containing protein [Microbacterium sp. DT81.1]|uniref:cupin domain-containing protein n=1 Tax=Microbacterium sp. DT81.1 TaxID=3393413 RepID=UPI003CF6AA7C
MTDVVFPGGTSVSRLRVYDDAVPAGFGVAPDGLPGGTPHLHTVSTEAYVVTAGSGSLQTLDRTGYREHDLAPGATVWFAPGTIHRVVNGGGLEVVVIMSNRGLPEAGDAVMTFADEVLADAERYGEAARLPDAAPDRSAAAEAARARRDAAVRGFVALRAAVQGGDLAPLERFYERAAALVAPRSAEWSRLRKDSVLADARRGEQLLAEIASGSAALLGAAEPRSSSGAEGERRFGMCGLLRTYDVD